MGKREKKIRQLQDDLFEAEYMASQLSGEVDRYIRSIGEAVNSLRALPMVPMGHLEDSVDAIVRLLERPDW